MKFNTLIDAIKKLREMSTFDVKVTQGDVMKGENLLTISPVRGGIGLKDAKDFCEAVMDLAGTKGLETSTMKVTRADAFNQSYYTCINVGRYVAIWIPNDTVAADGVMAIYLQHRSSGTAIKVQFS